MNKNWMLQLVLGLTAGILSHGKGVSEYVKADLVLGQASYTKRDFTTLGAGTMDDPCALAIDSRSRKVFVADSLNNRVLRFGNIDALKNGADAEAVFGQSSFTAFQSLVGLPPQIDPTLSNPEGLFVDKKGRLWVADSGNNRVVVYHSASSLPGSPRPDHVYGVPDDSFFLQAYRGAATMNFPTGVCIDGEDRLWVADKLNHRVLRFDAISGKPDGAPADGVLGPSDFTSFSASPEANLLMYPHALAVTSQGTLFVTDIRNRILRFDHAAGLPNGAFPDGVLGQPNFWSSVQGLSNNRMTSPTGLFITADDTMWVTDSSFARLLRFDRVSTKKNGAAADGVLGQRDFISGSGLTSRSTMSWPKGGAVVDVDGRLWICDTGANRVLRFAKDATRPVLTLKTKVSKKPVAKFQAFEGTVSDQNTISGVYYKLDGKAAKVSTLTKNRWKIVTPPLRKGRHTLDVHAVDGAGNTSKILKISVQSTGKF